VKTQPPSLTFRWAWSPSAACARMRRSSPRSSRGKGQLAWPMGIPCGHIPVLRCIRRLAHIPVLRRIQAPAHQSRLKPSLI